MTAAERAERTRAADALCAAAYAEAGCPEQGVALVAVGGYGRSELAPYSDLDVVLVHDAEVEPGEWAGRVWYPLWDSGAQVDHAVRTVQEVLDQASADLRVATGMLDCRHLAGDAGLTLRLRTAVLTQWRRDARLRLAELQGLVADRRRDHPELAHASVPDLKQSTGGLRDATLLRALVASWLVDVPHADLERTRLALLDVRDALHAVAGRGTDRVVPEYWTDLAGALGLPDGEGRPLRAFQERQREESRDCDLSVAAAADEIPALAADGDLFDLARALKGWTAAPGAPPLRPVLDGERAFGLPVRADDATGVMVLSVHGRNPGGALEVLRALADARLRDD